MLLLVFKITTLLIPILALGLGLFSLARNPKSKVVRLWFLSSMAIAVWGGGLSMVLISQSASQAYFYDILLHFGSALIPILFFHFISAFLYRDSQKDRIALIIGYIVAVLFILVVLIKPLWLVSSSAGLNGFEYWVNGGPLYIPFVIYFWIYAVLIFYLLIKSFVQSDGVVKRSLFYILLAALVGYLGGGTSFLPQLFGIYPFGNFVTFLYPILITYGIFLKKD